MALLRVMISLLKNLMLMAGFADTWIGMAFVLGGIALCVQSKNT